MAQSSNTTPETLSDTLRRMGRYLGRAVRSRETDPDRLIRRYRRDIPAALREEVRYAVDALEMQGDPKLMVQVDYARIDRTLARARGFAATADTGKARVQRRLGLLASLVINLGLLAAATGAVLAWKGLI